MTTTESSADRKGVVVGVDGSDPSRHALAWVQAKSDVLGPVTPLLAYQLDPVVDGSGLAYAYVELTEKMEEAAKTRLVNSLPEDEEITSRATLVTGHTGRSLVSAAKNADLLVVGNRGRSAAQETLLGSVGSYCVKHANVPVAVITEDTKIEETIDRIVVGVDGSPNSVAALTWALDHVSEEGRILALGTWAVPPYSEAFPISEGEMEARIRAKIEHAITSARSSSRRETEPRIEIQVRYGDPRIVLRDAADDADLLVIGARGHSGIAHLILGSVATSLLHHPTIATVVVPAT